LIGFAQITIIQMLWQNKHYDPKHKKVSHTACCLICFKQNSWNIFGMNVNLDFPLAISVKFWTKYMLIGIPVGSFLPGYTTYILSLFGQQTVFINLHKVLIRTTLFCTIFLDITCCNCHKKGHKRWRCPQLQGQRRRGRQGRNR
jgi:hypothetical protein